VFAIASGEMTEDEFIRFLNETLELISSHAAGGAIVYACMDWRHMGELPDIFVTMIRSIAFPSSSTGCRTRF
jgi:hypothetical protein